MPADAFFFFIAAHDHGHRVPADDALDAAFDLAVAGKCRLFFFGNGIDIRSV